MYKKKELICSDRMRHFTYILTKNLKEEKIYSTINGVIKEIEKIISDKIFPICSRLLKRRIKEDGQSMNLMGGV